MRFTTFPIVGNDRQWFNLSFTPEGTSFHFDNYPEIVKIRHYTNMVRSAHDSCPKTATLFSLLGKKWIIFLIKTLSEGHESFNDIRRSIWSPSAKILTMRLQDLQKAGIVERVVVTQEPLCIRYRLTHIGQELSKFLCHLSVWWWKKPHIQEK